jgi:HSF-type DNA-binding
MNGPRSSSGPNRKVRNQQNFPNKLYEMLRQLEVEGHDDVASWRSHGRAFLIHNPKVFEETILPRYGQKQT